MTTNKLNSLSFQDSADEWAEAYHELMSAGEYPTLIPSSAVFKVNRPKETLTIDLFGTDDLPY